MAASADAPQSDAALQRVLRQRMSNRKTGLPYCERRHKSSHCVLSSTDCSLCKRLFVASWRGAAMMSVMAWSCHDVCHGVELP
eukprot:3940302-Rhodomonas_salina.3